MKTIRGNSGNKDFLELVKLLDMELAQKNGENNAFFALYNQVEAISNVVVLYDKELPVACGAFKEYEPGTVEVKRMYVKYDQRKRGYATVVLKELEQWATELGVEKCILETGREMSEAIALYRKNQYLSIPNYGQYKGVELSVCFAKILKQG